MRFVSSNLNYIDPGTGSYIYQILIAAGVAVGVYFKSTKAYIFSIISKIRKKDKN